MPTYVITQASRIDECPASLPVPVAVVVRGDKTAVCECDSLHVGNGLVGVVRRAVGEEVVDEHADYGEEEDDKSPEDLVWHGAVRLEDLNCSTNTSATVP